MASNKKWISTKDLVGTTFHVNDVFIRKYRVWNETTGKYDFSDDPRQGMQPCWTIELDEGTWQASYGQYTQLLIACEAGGMADVLGKTFECSSNGKEGKDVRYYFKLTK